MPESFSDFLNTFLGENPLTAILDIAVVAVLIYWLFVLIRGTRAVRILIGLSIVALVYLAAQVLHLQLLSTLLQAGAVVGLFAVVVVFQPELRRGLEQIGRMGCPGRRRHRRFCAPLCSNRSHGQL